MIEFRQTSVVIHAFLGEQPNPIDKIDNEAHPELKGSAFKSRLKQIGSKMSGGREVSAGDVAVIWWADGSKTLSR